MQTALFSFLIVQDSPLFWSWTHINYINKIKITKTLKFFSLKDYVMNNKTAQKAVAYLCDSHNWHTKLANHKIAPILSFVASPIFLRDARSSQNCKKVILMPCKKMGPKSMRHQSAFPYGSSQVSKTHPSQESCQTMIDGNSMNIHYIDFTYIRQSPFRIQVSV